MNSGDEARVPYVGGVRRGGERENGWIEFTIEGWRTHTRGWRREEAGG